MRTSVHFGTVYLKKLNTVSIQKYYVPQIVVIIAKIQVRENSRTKRKDLKKRLKTVDNISIICHVSASCATSDFALLQPTNRNHHICPSSAYSDIVSF